MEVVNSVLGVVKMVNRFLSGIFKFFFFLILTLRVAFQPCRSSS